ncbi:MAG: peptidoglycan DD-metalloendopeptidase family protein [bacterium]|nr:peptidoglycan DD-metalloendopeptidase family protein [bacterium]
MVRKRIILLGLFLGIAAAIVVAQIKPAGLILDPLQTIRISIPTGATFIDAMRYLGVATSTSQSILNSAQDKYNLAKIVSGRELALSFDVFSGDLKKMVYKIDVDNQLIVEDADSEADPENKWGAKVEPIPYEVRERSGGGVISKSLYQTIVSQGLDERLALALAEAFAWQIDFATDIQEDDSFKVVYEERYLDGRYVMPGRIMAASFINAGESFKGYYFEGTEKTRAGHYDENGGALQKEFLKSPLQYKYISSGYSLARYNPITKKTSPHRGIDYAAPSGTPAVSVGDGTVTQAGWNGYYGISVTVRHNDTYKTVYGHFSRLAKGIKVGAKVSQGQVVGYVGSTGLSTGPHLHYEMHKFSSYVNPFKVEIPPGDPVNEMDRAAFEKVVSKYSGSI